MKTKEMNLDLKPDFFFFFGVLLHLFVTFGANFMLVISIELQFYGPLSAVMAFFCFPDPSLKPDVILLQHLVQSLFVSLIL